MDEVTSDTLADRCYRDLRQHIADGTLAAGEKITERGLAARLSVSATPIREALRRLEQDGVVTRFGPRTLRVATIGDTEIGELVEVEVALRGLVARLAARHATSAELDHLDEILSQADDLLIVLHHRHTQGMDLTAHSATLFDVMQEFNRAVEAACHNPLLVRMLDQSRSFSTSEQRETTLHRIADGEHFGLDRYSGHRQLVRALRARDAVAAEALVIEHATAAIRAISLSD